MKITMIEKGKFEKKLRSMMIFIEVERMHRVYKKSSHFFLFKQELHVFGYLVLFVRYNLLAISVY